MAVIAPTVLSTLTPNTVTRTVLGASDTMTYTKGKTKYLILDNITVGALTPNIDGAGATTQYANGVGSIDISAGYTVPSIGASETVIVELDNIASYLSGVITVTGGDGIEASIIEVR